MISTLAFPCVVHCHADPPIPRAALLADLRHGKYGKRLIWRCPVEEAETCRWKIQMIVAEHHWAKCSYLSGVQRDWESKSTLFVVVEKTFVKSAFQNRHSPM